MGETFSGADGDDGRSGGSTACCRRPIPDHRGGPEDVAPVSYDDFEWAAHFRPRLTTMAQPIQEIGAEAVRLLFARIADPRREPRTVRPQPRFMHRESCGCALSAG